MATLMPPGTDRDSKSQGHQSGIWRYAETVSSSERYSHQAILTQYSQAGNVKDIYRSDSVHITNTSLV